MIKANELRIGNWVNVPHGNVIIEKFITDGVHFTDGCGGTFQSLEAIPLTPKILEKCGFKKTNKEGNHTLVEYVKDFSENVKGSNKHEFVWLSFESGFCNYTVNDCWAGNNFQSLHQLQNLYYAITTEEINCDFTQTINNKNP